MRRRADGLKISENEIWNSGEVADSFQYIPSLTVHKIWKGSFEISVQPQNSSVMGIDLD